MRRREALSLKETKTIRGMDANSLALSGSPADDDVDSIVDTTLKGQTISIVIPLSAQLSTITSRVAETLSKDNVIEEKEADGELNLNSHQSHSQENASQEEESISHGLTAEQTIKGKELVSWLNGYRADKTKGCPFPSCSRYGRAFSRAHDLKRHIARHETRKERLAETNGGDKHTCAQCGENFSNASILQRHARLHTDSAQVQQAAGLETTRVTYCGVCKKKYTDEGKLKAHLASHDKKSERNVCPLCNCHFEQEEMLQNHMRDHTTNIVQTEQDFTKVNDKSTQAKEDDDDGEFLLEEMLLLNKKPRIHEPSGKNHSGAVAASSTSASSSSSAANGSNSKIRCDYCSKTFKTKWTLSSHVAAHEGRFQFGCARCGKKFVRKSHFEGHVRSHEAARPYVCEQCGKTFKELKHRREHTKRKHPGNRNAIQNLFDSISACVSEESTVEQTKFTLLMPINFGA